jgi:hypothetical protein
VVLLQVLLINVLLFPISLPISDSLLDVHSRHFVLRLDASKIVDSAIDDVHD